MTVDYSDGRSVRDITAGLLGEFRRALAAAGTPDCATFRALVPRAKAWLRELRAHVLQIPAHEAATALRGADTLHRLAWHEAASSALVCDPVLRAFETRSRGDRRVSEEDLVRAVGLCLQRRDPRFYGAPLRWRAETLGRWHGEFSLHGEFRGVPEPEARERARLLLNEDLYAFEGSAQAAFKSRLAARYLHSVQCGETV